MHIPPQIHNLLVIERARKHNLKNINVEIPVDQLFPIADGGDREGAHSPNKVRPATI